jgi:hypothetical protein
MISQKSWSENYGKEEMWDPESHVILPKNIRNIYSESI